MIVVNIVIMGNTDNTVLEKRLTEILGKKYSVLSFAQKSLDAVSDQPDFFICHTDSIHRVNLKNLILLFSCDGPLSQSLSLPPDCIAIVDSAYQQTIRWLSALSIRAITFGLRHKDTITTSSMADDSLVVSLQRSIHTLSGELLEPFEMPMRLPRWKDQIGLIMQICGVLLLCGKQDSILDIMR